MSTKAVLVPYPVDRAYDYAIPDGLDVSDGDYVIAPLGGRNVAGVVWGGGGHEKVAANKLKPLYSRYDLPPMPEAQRKFLDWAAHYTMSPMGSFLKLALSVPGALEPPKMVRAYRLRKWDGGQGLSPPAKRVMEIAADGLARKASEFAREAGCGAGVVKTLAEKGLLEEISQPDPAPCRRPDFDRDGAVLLPAQKKAAEALCLAFSKPQ